MTDTIELEARELLDDLQQAEAEYRLMHDRHGDGSQAAGRAWDLMRRAGDKARKALTLQPPSIDREGMPSREAIARALYLCERNRADHSAQVLSTALPGAIFDGIKIEPWEECCEVYLSDADAVLALNPSPPTDREAIRAEAFEEAARVAEAIAEAADKQVAFYDSYGGPEMSGRRVEVCRSLTARESAKAIRALSPSDRAGPSDEA